MLFQHLLKLMSIRVFDILFSMFLILILIPFIPLIIFLIIIFIEYPPFYVSERIGRHKLKYRHIKFKSMKSGPETGRVFFEQDRINAFGRFIRKLHIDEIPELFLILIDKMSFVGPRALPEKLLKGLDNNKRSSILPGITCLAQIYLLKKGYLDKHLQIRLDNLYVKKRSLKYNIKIMAATIYYATKSSKLKTDPDLNKARKEFSEKL